MDKRCKLVMLPSNKKANKGDIISNGRNLFLYGERFYNPYSGCYQLQHLYITSDDKIKEGDWFIVELFKIDGTSDGLHVEQANSIEDVWINKGVTVRRHSGNCKKIIATTDSSLWKHDDTVPYPKTKPALPQPTQSFIQKYVDEYNKGNIITDVLVECGRKSYPIDDYSIAEEEEYSLKVSKDNTITVRKINPKGEHILRFVDDVINEFPETNLEYLKLRAETWINNNL